MTYRHPQLTEIDRVARTRREFVRKWLPLDVPAFVEQVKALPVFKDCPRSIARTKVEIVYTSFATGGRAHGNRLARIRVSPSADLAWILDTIVHELVHCALPNGTMHNERFRLTLARAARELWGIEVDPNPKNEKGRVRRYALDDNIEEKLRAALEARTLEYPKRGSPAAEEIKAKRKADSNARIEKRAAHATRMWWRWERKVKAAQRALAKWRAKVRYYERQAAKRSKENES